MLEYDQASAQRAELQSLQEMIATEADPEVRARMWAAKWFAQGLTVREVSRRLGKSPRTIQRWIKLYRELGTEELIRRARGEHRRGGRPERLTDSQIRELPQQITQRQLSSVLQILEWVREEYGVTYSNQGMSGLLKRKGIRLHRQLVDGRRGKMSRRARQDLMVNIQKGKIRDIRSAIRWVWRKQRVKYTYAGMYSLLDRAGFQVQRDKDLGTRKLVAKQDPKRP